MTDSSFLYTDYSPVVIVISVTRRIRVNSDANPLKNDCSELELASLAQGVAVSSYLADSVQKVPNLAVTHGIYRDFPV